MKPILFLFLLFIFSFQSIAQNLYFPPTVTDAWDTVGLSELGWCSDQLPPLYDFLEGSHTKAFIVLKDGKIAIEKYFGTFTQDSLWYWASAGKTITAFMVGIAQQEGYLSISDTSSSYLGQGWTNLTSSQEEKITIYHQLTMSSGLDDAVPDVHCTLPSCLIYKADAGTRWAYHNGPYTLLQDVVANATGTNFNTYLNPRLKLPTGMDGLFVGIGYTSVYFSKPRSMARFGLLMLNNGSWNGTQLMTDMTYFNEMVTPSQVLNHSYGYLWWLNGQSSFMLPSTQFTFPGYAFPNAPADIYAAMGKNGQILNVSPSNNLVVIRMGNSPDSSFVPNLYNDTIWQKLNPVMCSTSSSEGVKALEATVYPNPTTGKIFIHTVDQIKEIQVRNMSGQIMSEFSDFQGTNSINIAPLPPGIYFVYIETASGLIVKKILRE